MDDAQLRTIWQQRQLPPAGVALTQPLSVLMKYKVEPRAKGLAKFVGLWEEVIPAEFREHTSLESFNRGVLTVAVDSAPHRFQLRNLLTAGLERELRSRYSGTLKKIKLVPGKFWTRDRAGAQRYEL